jgi:hypothetical protein
MLPYLLSPIFIFGNPSLLSATFLFPLSPATLLLPLGWLEILLDPVNRS